MEIEIQEINPANAGDVNRCEGAFSIARRIVPRVEEGADFMERKASILEAFPFNKTLLLATTFVLFLFTALIVSGCRLSPRPAGEELENVPGAYIFSQGSTDYPHLYQRAVEYLEENEFSQAEAVYRDLIEKEPNEINGYIGLGTSLALQGYHEEATEAYEAVLEMVPNSVEALVGLAAAYVGQELYPQAAETYRQALVFDPENPNAHYGLATVLVPLGEIEEAIVHYEKVIELAPNSGLAAEANNQIEAVRQGRD